jgi:hypothetical protein
MKPCSDDAQQCLHIDGYYADEQCGYSGKTFTVTCECGGIMVSRDTRGWLYECPCDDCDRIFYDNIGCDPE